ncbi:membrane protein [Buttiauxella gaviniae ATCC 51604]|uniref:Membrane protein n=1 Tax=Buttiauxella gaviniae ATCC 51604 TaxID=1354253 RepID=A0A1B7HX18_9ENTR|nr:hypothetical protein [Buttiauxella gaviniae]OAT20215.1 membrane protein [Buttiauxella gaviniae ATCC 51604]
MYNEKESLTKEEQLIILIDRYLTDQYELEDDMSSYKLYLILVGYHLKYFYPHALYCNSISNIDNIMQMFCSVCNCMEGNLIQRLKNNECVIFKLNALVDYIEGNQIRLEQVYVELKAQYEKKEISIITTPCKPLKRPRL